MCEPDLAEDEHKVPGVSTKGTKRLPKIRPAVIKYNFRAHWLRAHGSSTMPLGLARALELAPNESAFLAANKGGKVSEVAQKATTNAQQLA